LSRANHLQQIVALDVRQAEIEHHQSSGFSASVSSAILPFGGFQDVIALRC
jgi:hypothetical protein